MTNEDGLAHLYSSRPCFIFSVPVLTLLLLIGWRASAAELTKHFNLPSQDLSSALLEFNRQSGVQTLFGYDESESAVIDTIRTGSVVGDFTAQEALDRLLDGTGLQFRFYAPNKIKVFFPPSGQPSAVTPAQRQSSVTVIDPTPHLTPIAEVQVTGSRIESLSD